MADKLTVTLHVHKRWFFVPALLGTVALARLGILRDIERASRWLAANAMRIEVHQ